MVSAPIFVPSHITTYGAAHTIVSLAPVLLGLYLFLVKGTIDLKNPLGKAYWATAMIGTLTGLFIFHHGGFGPPHAVTIFMAVILLIAAVARWLPFSHKVEVICLSLSYFFLWFFTTTETLTRFPAAKPFAPSPEAIELAPVRVVLLLILVAGIWLQLRKPKAAAA